MNGREAPQSLKRWRSCKLQGKIEEGQIRSDRGRVMEMEGVWNLGRMGILSCIRASITTLLCVLVLVVEAVVVLSVVSV